MSNRNVHKIEVQGMDSERVDIHETGDEFRTQRDSNPNRQQPLQCSGSKHAKKRNPRSVLVCLVLPCVLLTVIVLCIRIGRNNHNCHIKSEILFEERDQLLTKYINITEERNQLLTKYINITEERDQLLTKYTNITEERDQLLTKYTNITEERDQLLTKYTNITEERDQLLAKYTNITEERDQLLTKYTNITEERDQLLTKYTNITEERDQLLTKYTNITEERNQLLTKHTNITEERDQLLTKYTNITEERDQLLTKYINIYKEKNQLLSKYTNITEETAELKVKYNNVNKLSEQQNQEKNELWGHLHDGWIYYEFGLYFISSEKNNWTESRRFCRERGADLIIINNKEEQEFVLNVTGGEETWIGLSDSDVESRWKWVDGSTMTSDFWALREPNGGTRENCAESFRSGWNDNSCSKIKKWICERNIF